MSLSELGFGPFFEEALAAGGMDGAVPARVVRSSSGSVDVALGSGDVVAVVVPRGRLPVVVGDWLVVDLARAVVRAALPRRTAFVRQASGRRTEAQIVASNIDVLFVLMALDGDFNLRRLERYVTIALASRVPPVVFLTKAAQCSELDARIREVRAVTDVEVHPLDVLAGIGTEAPGRYLTLGTTAALVGSSGVGKSTLLNHLLGAERMRTAPVRASDARGRHTTTHRELFCLPGGGAVIDTPGMRELQVWGEPEDLDAAFSDLTALASACRFADCGHVAEPGCAVQAAIAGGALASERLESFRRLRAELELNASRRKDGDRSPNARKHGRTGKDAQGRKHGKD